MSIYEKYLKYKSKYISSRLKRQHGGKSKDDNFLSLNIGKINTKEYKVYLVKYENKKILPLSPFHDIPLWFIEQEKIANMVVEIPKGTDLKLEINKEIVLNPITYDIKNDKIRIVGMKYPANYGALPQTWENPNITNELTNAKGDNDPIDAMDISNIISETGSVIRVKILGVFAMIDEGETDWKIICINIKDCNANKINNLDDIEEILPNKLKEIFEFLRDYKIPDGKPPNKFAFDGKPQDKNLAIKVIEETHLEWQKLIKEIIPSNNISLLNTTNCSNNLIKFNSN